MIRRRSLRIASPALLGWALWLLLPAPAGAQPRQPIFVGAKVCGECHDGKAMGDQHSLWMRSRHAKAYASLSTPEAKKIALLSGIPVEPQKSPMCLGCHSTGAEAEEWEKEEGFALEDGVQCEKCHGPGSEYMDAEVMQNRELAISKGMRLSNVDDCIKCHLEKGSHTAVLGRPPLDLTKAIRDIAHPTPENWKLQKLKFPPVAAEAGADRPRYTGSLACGGCHGGREQGFQYSRWRSSKHAEAFATLATPAAARIAAEMGVKEDPRVSVTCLACHSTAYHRPAGGPLEPLALHEGVGCEACHGPGSQHAAGAARDPAVKVALPKTDEATCKACHANAHGKPFDYPKALAAIAHPTRLPPLAVEPTYKTPINLALRPGSDELYVACEAAGTVAVVDRRRRTKIAEFAVGGQPQDIAFTPDGAKAFVSNRLDDTVSIVDSVARKAVATLAVGDEPHGVIVDRAGKRLYVLNTSSDTIAVFDVATLQQEKILAASRNPWSLALSPDGSRILVTNSLSRFVEFPRSSTSEVTVIDVERAVVEDRVVVPDTNLLQGIAWHPSGRFGLSTMLRTKNRVPMTRLLQGWTITNGLAVIWADGEQDQVLLDDPGLSFPDPTDVAITPDGRFALVTSSSTDRVAVVDVAKLIALVEKTPADQRKQRLPNHLGKAGEFVVAHLATKDSPRGVVVDPSSKTAFVANSLDDSLSVLDLETLRTVERIDLGGPREITQARYGERLFNSAKITFRRQFSCHSCHPDGHVDGLTYDIESDGIGIDPVDNRTLRGILDTAPFKWAGTNVSLSRQCGARLSVFFTRLAPFTPEQLAAVDLYVCTIPRPPNLHRPLGAKLTDAQRRGKALFERTRSNDGKEIPRQQRCATCHFPPLYTDRQRHDVGTRMRLDKLAEFDVPHLNNIYDSAPYLHNGVAESLEEIWTKYNPYDQHGVTNDMTKDQLNDLIEYLKTL